MAPPTRHQRGSGGPAPHHRQQHQQHQHNQQGRPQQAAQPPPAAPGQGGGGSGSSGPAVVSLQRELGIALDASQPLVSGWSITARGGTPVSLGTHTVTQSVKACKLLVRYSHMCAAAVSCCRALAVPPLASCMQSWRHTRQTGEVGPCLRCFCWTCNPIQPNLFHPALRVWSVLYIAPFGKHKYDLPRSLCCPSQSGSPCSSCTHT